jgi:uncharacterized protein YjbI with pentapeptide repeats
MSDLNDEILLRLRQRRSLKGLGLEKVDGRWVVRDLAFPQPVVTGHIDAAGRDWATITGKLNLSWIWWRNIHFVNCNFSNVGLFHDRLTNCVFEKCVCEQMGFWSAKVRDCRFVRCSLRHAALGGTAAIHRFTRPCKFLGVVFEKCDFRGSAHSVEWYLRCSFLGCRLDDVDFHGAVFEDCEFQGLLNEVRFYHRFPLCPLNRPNRMLRCDFRKATLRDCEFMNIDIDPTLLPADDDLVILPHGPADLIRWRERLTRYESYVDRLIKLSGTPAVQSRASLLELYSPEEVQILVDIANGAA